MNRREKHHAVGAALGIEAVVVANRVQLCVPDAAFLVQLPSGGLQGRFSRLDVTALGLPGVPLPVAAEKPLPVVPGADDNEGIRPQCPHRVDGALQRPAALARCIHYTNLPQKRKAFFPEFRLKSSVFQHIIALSPEPALLRLGGDAAAGVVFRNAVPAHKAANPVFHRGSDGDRHIAQLGQSPFKQRDSVDGGKGRLFRKAAEYLPLHSGVGDSVQIQQGVFVGKYQISKFFPQQNAVLHHSREARLDGREKGCVPCQQLVVDGVAVQNHRPPLLQDIQQGGFSAAGTAGDAENHASSSASTMWNAAAFFSRFCTA